MSNSSLTLPDEIIRTMRKTILLEIKEGEKFIVRAPKIASDQDIMDFVKKKQSWINLKLNNEKKKAQLYKKINVIDGEEILFLGDKYTIKLVEDSIETSKVFFKDKYICVPNVEDKNIILKKWYMQNALDILSKKVKFYASVINVQPGNINISNAKTRWGYCGQKNNLTFNWRIIMCPEKIVDYLVIHELSHIIHKNHSRRFYDFVKIYMDDFNKAEIWLKENSQIINILRD